MKKQIDYKKLTFDMCRKLAAGGDADALCELALRYYSGVGVRISRKTSAELFLTAANGGSAKAMYRLGMMYFRADGVEFDADRGYEWLMRSVAASDEYREEISDTLYRIGEDMYDGNYEVDDEGIPCELDADKERGFAYMEKAMELGCCDRYYDFGLVCYFDKRDYARALENFEKGRFIKSWALTGKMYACGEGTKVDFDKAADYFAMCAEYDERYAFAPAASKDGTVESCKAGYCYFCVGEFFDGDIMTFDHYDKAQAEKYYALAKANGYDPALAPKRSNDCDFYD